MNSKHLKEIRSSFISGTPRPSCNNCWHEEHSGIVSRRETELYRYKDRITDILENHSYPIYLDLKLGNICNSICRICTSFASSKWAAEETLQGNDIAKIHLQQGKWPRINKLF